MTVTVPSIEPTCLTAGDSATWTFANSDYPSSTFTLSYRVVGAGKLVWDPTWVTANADESYTVFVPMTATAGLDGGSYLFTRNVTDGTTGKTWNLPPLNIADNPANLEAGETATSLLEANVAALRAAIAKRIAGDEPEEYAIGGMSVKKMTIVTLQTMLSREQTALWRRRNPGKSRHRVMRFNPVGFYS